MDLDLGGRKPPFPKRPKPGGDKRTGGWQRSADDLAFLPKKTRDTAAGTKIRDRPPHYIEPKCCTRARNASLLATVEKESIFWTERGDAAGTQYVRTLFFDTHTCSLFLEGDYVFPVVTHQ